MVLNHLKRNISIMKISTDIHCIIIQYIRVWIGLQVSDIALSQFFFFLLAFVKTNFRCTSAHFKGTFRKNCYLIENFYVKT